MVFFLPPLFFGVFLLFVVGFWGGWGGVWRSLEPFTLGAFGVAFFCFFFFSLFASGSIRHGHQERRVSCLDNKGKGLPRWAEHAPEKTGYDLSHDVTGRRGKKLTHPLHIFIHDILDV